MKNNIASFYLRELNDGGFDSIMAEVFRVLGVREYEKRHSDNYPGGQYATGAALGFTIVGAVAAEPEFPDYSYVVIVKPKTQITDGTSIAGIEEMIAKELSRGGFSVLVDIDVGKKGGRTLCFSGQ